MHTRTADLVKNKSKYEDPTKWILKQGTLVHVVQSATTRMETVLYGAMNVNNANVLSMN